MKPLALLGIGAGALLLFAFKKKSDYTKVIEKMTWDIGSVKNLRHKAGKLVFDIDVVFHNNTPFEFNFATAGLIVLRRVNVMHGGKMIGTAMSNTTSIELEPYGHFTVQDIQVEVTLATVISQITNGGLDLNTENYSLQIQIDALGQTFLID